MSIFLLLLCLAGLAEGGSGEVSAEDVTYPAGDITVAATLFRPQGPGPFPAVVIAHGSGPGSRRDAAKRLFAERLASGGIAVLLPDKRGVGESTGVYVETEWLDLLSSDQLAGVRFLKGRSGIAANRVGVMGTSQGGWVSQISAASGEAAFGVSISGPGVGPLEQVVAQRINERLDEGMSTGDAEVLRAWWLSLWKYYGTAAGYEDVVARAKALPDRPWFADARAGRIAPPSMLSDEQFTFFRKLVHYDPAPTLARIRVPFVGVFGGKDRHIPMPESADAMAAAFAGGGNTAASVRIFPGAGHGIQPVDGIETLGGGPRAAPLPEFLDFLERWIRDVASAASRAPRER